MGKILLYILLTGTGVTSLFRPWIGIVASYFIIILNPQNIWWWNFQDIRPHYLIMLATIIGFCIALLQGRVGFDSIKNKINLFMTILWACFVLSYYWGPYVTIPSEYRFHDPKYIFLLMNKIFILYFISCFCINDQKKLKYLSLILIISVIYLIWWTNSQYLFEGFYGRIGGPTGLAEGGIYSDENAFAMIFVIGLPFLYFMGSYLKHSFLRYGLWLIIPFGWHAIFLTGSRGGLVGLAMTILISAIRSPKKITGILLILALIVAYVWQAGDVMKDRASTISTYQEDSSAVNRIEAWTTAVKMIKDHPILGVGFTSFGPAYPQYSMSQPRQAHNTFFQIAAESGILAGIMYIFICTFSIFYLWRNSRKYKIGIKTEHKDNFLFYLNESLLVSFAGFITCSLFLSLSFYEVFYFLILLISSSINISKDTHEQPSALPHKTM